MKICVALLALAIWGAAAAQGVYKCKDAAGKITYSDSECNLIGLNPAGEVTDRSSVSPALAPSAARPAPSAAPSNPPAAAGKSAAAEPAAPEKRCFVVKTAKGTVTRCNDVPEEAAEGK